MTAKLQTYRVTAKAFGRKRKEKMLAEVPDMVLTAEVAARTVKEGDLLRLTESEAAYELTLGNIELVPTEDVSAAEKRAAPKAPKDVGGLARTADNRPKPNP
jgi:hypothetical protein